jgi:hypothetical protein
VPALAARSRRRHFLTTKAFPFFSSRILVRSQVQAFDTLSRAHWVDDYMKKPETQSSSDARVGIYWGIIHSAEDLELITDMTSLSEAERYGEFLTHPRGHYDVWESWRQSGPRGLAKLRLPKLIAWTEYETVPRGRVVYNTATQHFIIYADRRLQRASFSREIADRFGLASSSYSIVSDAHYSEIASF